MSVVFPVSVQFKRPISLEFQYLSFYGVFEPNICLMFEHLRSN